MIGGEIERDAAAEGDRHPGQQPPCAGFRAQPRAQGLDDRRPNAKARRHKAPAGAVRPTGQAPAIPWDRPGRPGSAIPYTLRYATEAEATGTCGCANSGTDQERTMTALLFLFHRHGHIRLGREPHLVALDIGDEPLVDEVMVALVAALAAVLLGQLDAV